MSDPNTACQAQNLVDFQSRMNNLDAFHSGDFADAPPNKRMAYVGKGIYTHQCHVKCKFSILIPFSKKNQKPFHGFHFLC